MAKEPAHPRSAKVQLEAVTRLRSLLQLTKVSTDDLGLDSSAIDDLLIESRVLEQKLYHLASGRIEPRRRFKPVTRPEGTHIPEYYLFLDECGSHVPGRPDERFPVFCLSGVVVSRDEYEQFDTMWKAWKAKHLGSIDIVVHEPDVRSFTGNFRRREPEQREQLRAELDLILGELEYACIASVVDMNAYVSEHPDGQVDDFLPSACYLMSMDFVLERFVHFLQYKGPDARGFVVAESRGAMEDAKLHAEFIRLHIEGTQYISDSAFRHQLRPYIEFYRKSRNNSGLQIADLAARPFAERILKPDGTPVRWDTFSSKLYDGLKDAPHRYGLKVFPLTSTNDPFPGLPRKAKEDA